MGERGGREREREKRERERDRERRERHRGEREGGWGKRGKGHTICIIIQLSEVCGAELTRTGADFLLLTLPSATLPCREGHRKARTGHTFMHTHTLMKYFCNASFIDTEPPFRSKQKGFFLQHGQLNLPH